MPTELLTIGPIHSVNQTQVYALPSKAVTMFATAQINLSNNINMIPSIPIDTTEIPTKITAGFFQCTASTNCVVVFRAD